MVPRARHIRALLLRSVHSFFKADAVSVVKPPDRTHRRLNLLLCLALADLRQRQIGVLGDQCQQPARMRRQWRAAAALL